ncbi:hypothetical protein AAMO2058_000322400 [Amorphochlora amoebiformis]
MEDVRGAMESLSKGLEHIGKGTLDKYDWMFPGLMVLGGTSIGNTELTSGVACMVFLGCYFSFKSYHDVKKELANETLDLRTKLDGLHEKSSKFEIFQRDINKTLKEASTETGKTEVKVRYDRDTTSNYWGDNNLRYRLTVVTRDLISMKGRLEGSIREPDVNADAKEPLLIQSSPCNYQDSF